MDSMLFSIRVFYTPRGIRTYPAVDKNLCHAQASIIQYTTLPQIMRDTMQHF